MTIKEVLGKVKESEVFTLVYKRKVIGYRVKIFNPIQEKFEYYDMAVQDIKDHAVFHKISSPNALKVQFVQATSQFVTDAELQGKIEVSEVKSNRGISDILDQIDDVYSFKQEVIPNV